MSGGQGDPEAVVRPDRLPAGAVQHRRAAGSHHFYLCNHRDDNLRPRQAPGSHRRPRQLRDLREIHAAPLQVQSVRTL